MRIPAHIINDVRWAMHDDSQAIIGIGLAHPDTWVTVDFTCQHVPQGVEVLAYATWRDGRMLLAPALPMLAQSAVMPINRMSGTALASVARPCWPKMQHLSLAEAELHQQDILDKGLERNARRLHIYICPHCRGPKGEAVRHVGHAGKG